MCGVRCDHARDWEIGVDKVLSFKCPIKSLLFALKLNYIIYRLGIGKEGTEKIFVPSSVPSKPCSNLCGGQWVGGWVGGGGGGTMAS